MRGLAERGISGFALWFSSAACVWQTALVVLAWVVVEIFFPQIDPHGFVLLYVLSVYSALTQPALAYAANLSALASRRAEEAQHRSLQNQEAMMRALLAMMERMNEQDQDAGHRLAEILEHLSRDG